jgi:hypothetical protein
MMPILRTLLMVLLCAGTAEAKTPGLLLTQSFTLSQAYTYTWVAERPAITEGTIVVVQVDPEDARVRQVGGPVLYVGSVPAERTNNGDLDGVIVAFVPGKVDLTQTPIYWGPATLPERVDATKGSQILNESARPMSTKDVVTAATRPPLALSDAAALYRRIAELIDKHAPSEQDRARGYRGGSP